MFQLSGLAAGQLANIDWGVAVGVYGNNIATGVGNGTYLGTAVTTLLPNTSTGVSIYVRVTIQNNNFEGTAPTPITLAVDAVNSALQDDVDNTTCLVNAPFADLATQRLNARPAVGQVAPNVFLPIAP
jgi:hypothetical protein